MTTSSCNSTETDKRNSKIATVCNTFDNMLRLKRVNGITRRFSRLNSHGRILSLEGLKQQRVLQLQLTTAKNQPDYAHLDTFHRAIKPYIFFAHIFGLMPLVNTLSSNPQYVHFRGQSIAMIFTGIFLLFGSLKTLHYTMSMLTTGIHLKNAVSLFFFYITLIIFINFLSLARRWPRFLRYWTRVELIFLLPPYNKNTHGNSLQGKLCKLVLSLSLIALVEHCLYHASKYHNFHMTHQHCAANETQSTFRAFILQEYKDVFNYVPYSTLLAIYAILFNASFSFVWNFLDVFIMMVSLALATRFQQFARHVERLQNRHVPDAVWYDLRRDHILLCELTEVVNEHLSDFVLISCLNNSYFICNQLLSIFTKLRWPINYVYFWVSLGFLLLRTFGVFICASEIHDASELPLKTLHLIPSACWTEEVQRFSAQITQESIGLSGKGFYLVTRRNLFGLMAAIVTYEFMLLQFDANSPKVILPTSCG